MAIKIEFVGYVNQVRRYDWGIAYDVSHNQLLKKGDQWEVVGRDYFSVVAPDGSPSFNENDQVSVRGTLKTKYFEKKDGSKGIALNVRAEDMALFIKAAPNEPAVQTVWPDVKQIADSNAPF